MRWKLCRHDISSVQWREAPSGVHFNISKMLISRAWVWVLWYFYHTWKGQFISHISIPMRRPTQMIQIVSKNLIKESCTKFLLRTHPALQILHFHTIRPCWYNNVCCKVAIRSNTSRQDETRKRILHCTIGSLPVSFLCLWYETIFRDQGRVRISFFCALLALLWCYITSSPGFIEMPHLKTSTNL